MKKWIDASVIAERESVGKELWEIEDLMKRKPNWDKNKEKNYKKDNNKIRIIYK